MRALLILLMAMGCTGSPAAPAPPPAGPAEAPPAEPAGSVEVARDGKRFDPPVSKARIPEGAHYCDMGTVHYARMTEGDGQCPVCGMDLTKKVSALDAGE